MKKILVALLIVFTKPALAVCFVPISRDNINPGQIPTSTRYNADFDNLYTRANNVPGDCFLDASVRAKQIEDAALETSHFLDASVTAAKIASGVVPTIGRPIRVKAYTASGTWIKQADVESVMVQVIGGGGGSGGSGDTVSSGSTSSFGSHCSAGGGAMAKGGPAGSGGTASNGDVNLAGGDGERVFVEPVPRGGISFLGAFGKGASGSASSGGAGSGAYCSRLIQKASLADTVTVTIGAGGVGYISGKSGLVIVYEYGE